MPYTREFSRENKGCFLFLLDQSYSMVDSLGGGTQRKCDELVAAINGWLNNMVIESTKGDGVRHYMDVGIIGYRTDQQENPIIGPAFTGALEGKNLVPITEIAANARIEQRTMLMPDIETGENVEVPTEVPVWIGPVTEGGTPMCHTLFQAHEILQGWIAEHPRSFPPVVIHITDGETTDGGDPVPYSEAIMSLATEDGNVLMFNCHLSMTAADPCIFPSSDELLPDEFSRLLFHMSSVIPEAMVDRAVKEGFSMQPRARGMVFNADMITLLKFLEFGTKAAKNLR
jgi:hypothetical protein